jgi:MprA protease rhombosortase-interaction domain-containing protein
MLARFVAAIILSAIPVACALAAAVRVEAWTNSVYEGHADVPIVEFVEDGVTKYRIGTATSDSFAWGRAGDFLVTLSGTLDPDPSIGTVVAVQDFGAASAFAFSWSTAIVPAGPQVALRSRIDGSLSDFTGDGLSFAPTQPSGMALVSFLDTSFPATSPTTALAIGSAFGAPGPVTPGTAYAYSDTAGYPAALAGPAGTWTTLGMTLGFALSGNDDSAAFTLYSEVTAVPLPGAALLLAAGLAGFAPFTRRARRGA